MLPRAQLSLFVWIGFIIFCSLLIVSCRGGGGGGSSEPIPQPTPTPSPTPAPTPTPTPSPTPTPISRLYFRSDQFHGSNLPPQDYGYGSIFVDFWRGNTPGYSTLQTLSLSPGSSPVNTWWTWPGGSAEQYQGIARFAYALMAGDVIQGFPSLRMGMGENYWGEMPKLSFDIYIWRNGARLVTLFGLPNNCNTVGSDCILTPPDVAPDDWCVPANHSSCQYWPTAGHMPIQYCLTYTDPSDNTYTNCQDFQMTIQTAVNPPPNQISSNYAQVIYQEYNSSGYLIDSIPYDSDAIHGLYGSSPAQLSYNGFPLGAIGPFTAQLGDVLVIDINAWKNQHYDITQAMSIQYNGTSLTDPLNTMSYIEFSGANFHP